MTHRDEKSLKDAEADCASMVEDLCQILLSAPDKAVVKAESAGRCVAVEVRPDCQDVGRLVGKAGSMFRAVRDLLSCAAHPHSLHYVVVQQGEKQDFHGEPRFGNAEWAGGPLERFFRSVCSKSVRAEHRVQFRHGCGVTEVELYVGLSGEMAVPRIELRDALEVLARGVGKSHGWKVVVQQVGELAP